MFSTLEDLGSIVADSSRLIVCGAIRGCALAENGEGEYELIMEV